MRVVIATKQQKSAWASSSWKHLSQSPHYFNRNNLKMASKLNINYLNLEFSRFMGFLLMEVLLFNEKHVLIGLFLPDSDSSVTANGLFPALPSSDTRYQRFREVLIWAVYWDDQIEVWRSEFVSRATFQGSRVCATGVGHPLLQWGIGDCHLHSEIWLFIVDSEWTRGLHLIGCGRSESWVWGLKRSSFCLAHQ